MGIRNFAKFLREKCPEVFEPSHLSQYSYKRVAIDISLYLHKFKAACGDQWLGAFINLISSLRRNQLHCVFIFDGKPPPEKEQEQVKRKAARAKLEEKVYNLEQAMDSYYKTGMIDLILAKLYRTRKSPKRLLGKPSTSIDMDWLAYKVKQKRNQIIKISPEDFESAKELFRILEVPYYTAPGEAEKMCAKLCIDDQVYAVLSEDTDVIAYGAPRFLTKIDTQADTCLELSQEKLLESLLLNKSQLIDLCIMCGTDYNPNIFRVGAHTSYKYIKAHGTIENVAAATQHDTTILNHLRGRELFTRFDDYGIINIPYCGQYPNFDTLTEFVTNHRVWIRGDRDAIGNENTITNKLLRLRHDLGQSGLVFKES